MKRRAQNGLVQAPEGLRPQARAPLRLAELRERRAERVYDAAEQERFRTVFKRLRAFQDGVHPRRAVFGVAQGEGQVLRGERAAGGEHAVERLANLRRAYAGAPLVKVLLAGQKRDLRGAVALGGEPGALLFRGRRLGRVHPQPAAETFVLAFGGEDAGVPEDRFLAGAPHIPPGSANGVEPLGERAAAEAGILEAVVDAVALDEPAARAFHQVEAGAFGQREARGHVDAGDNVVAGERKRRGQAAAFHPGLGAGDRPAAADLVVD